MSPLTEWRRAVIAAAVDAFPQLGGHPVTGYTYPEVSPEAPAVALAPGIDGVYVDSAESAYCPAGYGQAVLTWIVALDWKEEAFDLLDTVASGARIAGIRSRDFSVVQIGSPGVVIDLPDLPTFIGLPIQIVSTHPIETAA